MARLRARRDEATARRRLIVESASLESRERLTPVEDSEFRALTEDLRRLGALAASTSHAGSSA